MPPRGVVVGPHIPMNGDDHNGTRRSLPAANDDGLDEDDDGAATASGNDAEEEDEEEEDLEEMDLDYRPAARRMRLMPAYAASTTTTTTTATSGSSATGKETAKQQQHLRHNRDHDYDDADDDDDHGAESQSQQKPSLSIRIKLPKKEKKEAKKEHHDLEDYMDVRSTTSYEDLEVCEVCKREGEVLECDMKGCEKVWHVECVPSLRGQVPEGRWVCPAAHDEVCEICEGTGEVVVCDVKNCQRVYHISCIPALKGVVPKGFWECPMCILDRETGLVCGVCKKTKMEGETLVRCADCTHAIHLGCLGAYGTRGRMACAPCNIKSHHTESRRRKTVQMVNVVLKRSASAIDKARVLQIMRGEGTGLRDEEAIAILDATISRKAS